MSCRILTVVTVKVSIVNESLLTANVKTSAQVRTWCVEEQKMMFIFEHYFASKSFAAVHEVFSSAYCDKEVPNNSSA
jgi:hypothetical protein